MHPERHAPYPEFFDPKFGMTPFEIQNTDEGGLIPPGMVDLSRRIMSVPLSAAGRPTVLHELGHVMFSPRKHPDLDFARAIFLAVEDARVNLALSARGAPIVVDEETRHIVHKLFEEDLKNGHPAMFVLRAIGSIGTSVEGIAYLLSFAPPVHDIARRLSVRVETELELARGEGEVAPIERVLELGREIQRELESRSWEVPTGPTCLGCTLARAVTDESEGIEVVEPVYFDHVDSGTMHLALAPLTRSAMPDGKAPRRKSTTEGSVVSAIHRWAIDRSIFRRRRGAAQGTVLIDVSGSMSFDDDDLHNILGPAPAATQVAMYSGSGDAGELRIIARDGRRAGPEHLTPFGGGNVIDVPALEWPAKQRGPRIWVSDGGVTGKGDAFAHSIHYRCRRICERGDIRQVEDPADAAAILAGREPATAPTPALQKQTRRARVSARTSARMFGSMSELRRRLGLHDPREED